MPREPARPQTSRVAASRKGRGHWRWSGSGLRSCAERHVRSYADTRCGTRLSVKRSGRRPLPARQRHALGLDEHVRRPEKFGQGREGHRHARDPDGKVRARLLDLGAGSSGHGASEPGAGQDRG